MKPSAGQFVVVLHNPCRKNAERAGVRAEKISGQPGEVWEVEFLDRFIDGDDKDGSQGFGNLSRSYRDGEIISNNMARF